MQKHPPRTPVCKTACRCMAKKGEAGAENPRIGTGPGHASRAVVVLKRQRKAAFRHPSPESPKHLPHPLLCNQHISVKKQTPI